MAREKKIKQKSRHEGRRSLEPVKVEIRKTIKRGGEEMKVI